jgi:hypothetical protein
VGERGGMGWGWVGEGGGRAQAARAAAAASHQVHWLRAFAPVKYKAGIPGRLRATCQASACYPNAPSAADNWACWFPCPHSGRLEVWLACP